MHYCILITHTSLYRSHYRMIKSGEPGTWGFYSHVLGELGCLIIDVGHSNAHRGGAGARDFTLVHCHHHKLIEVVGPLEVQRPGGENGTMRGDGEVGTQRVIGQLCILFWVAVISRHWSWENTHRKEEEEKSQISLPTSFNKNAFIFGADNYNSYFVLTALGCIADLNAVIVLVCGHSTSDLQNRFRTIGKERWSLNTPHQEDCYVVITGSPWKAKRKLNYIKQTTSCTTTCSNKVLIKHYKELSQGC